MVQIRKQWRLVKCKRWIIIQNIDLLHKQERNWIKEVSFNKNKIREWSSTHWDHWIIRIPRWKQGSQKNQRRRTRKRNFKSLQSQERWESSNWKLILIQILCFNYFFLIIITFYKSRIWSTNYIDKLIYVM